MSDRSIHIRRSLFGGVTLSIEPRTVDCPSREFHRHVDAVAFADALHVQHGWTIVDETGGAA